MENKRTPEKVQQMLCKGYIKESDILKTEDGFFLVYKSLADILLEKNIIDVPDSSGRRLMCDKFFDDWFLYSVPNGSDYTYSLVKLREQEHDAEEGAFADGDIPGVTISFISFDCSILFNCLDNPADENRTKLDNEINRVVARRGQRHHDALKRYFINPKSEGPYLVAVTYISHIASFSQNGYLDLPDHYKEIVRQRTANKHSKSLARLPQFIESLNQKAGYVICDHTRLYIKNQEALTQYEAAAILATHTGNTSLYSFAAEVEFHARFLTPAAKIKIPILGRSAYDSAIRADMSIGDAEFQGPAPFYREESRIVKRQYAQHQKNNIQMKL